MKIRYLTLTVVAVALVSIMALPVLAGAPGHSPGYWKHQFRAYYDGKGRPHESWADLLMWTSEIDARAHAGPMWWGMPLPGLAEIDLNGDGTFTTDEAYAIFANSRMNTLWIGLANWYNWAAGLHWYD